MTTSKTLNSDAVIAISHSAAVFDDMLDEIFDTSAFQNDITYRRFDIDEDNMTGDIDKSIYNDYEIYGNIDIEQIRHNTQKVGETEMSDATLFVPREIRTERDGTMITQSFRPQINDEVKENNIWYRIYSLQPHFIGEFEVELECGLKRVGNDNDDYWS